ncbi:MAG: flagellar biosynthetic protein FliP [Alphaproteobacteria bacterium RIFCSPHIGHO2_12_FULL_63_12]|nr:MAG: flagellar biosynthetic protein FliP [Alphaproteobacteria bacterium RIFCSPHIGHO2_12_FULL_63_12]
MLTLIAATLIADPSIAATIDAPTISSSVLSERVIQLFLLVTTLSLAPGIAMMATSLPLIVIVLSILRQGGGLQQSPPNMMIMGLAIFLTWLIMEPVFGKAWVAGVEPLLAGSITENEAVKEIVAPFSAFMTLRVDPSALQTLSDARGLAQGAADSPSLSLLAPAFVLSEIQRAFQIGFVILLPFLIIDLLVASILMAMGMMMVPPAIVSLPFKLSFFVLTNGWVAVSGALVRSYL